MHLVRHVVAALMAMALSWPVVVGAQGFDFPFGVWVPPPSSETMPIITPDRCCGGWGPFSEGLALGEDGYAWNQLWSVRAGSLVEGQVKWDFWQLGAPVQLIVRSPGATDMQWEDRAEFWNGTCLQNCYFRFMAGEDNPQVWIEYHGVQPFDGRQGYWLAHLQNFVVLREPQQEVNQPYQAIKQFIKDRAAAKSDDLGRAAAIIGAVSGALPWPLSLIAGAQSAFLGVQAIHFGAVARDPCDPNDPNNCDYGSWYDLQFVDACDLGCYAGEEAYEDVRIPQMYNQSLGGGLAMDAYMRAIIERANRSLVCDQFGNTDCREWQRLGAVDAAQNASYWAWVVAYWYGETAQVFRENGYEDAAFQMEMARDQLMSASDILRDVD